MADTLAHELGHGLLLDDALDLSCDGTIMGAQNTDPSGNTISRTVTSDDCNTANSQWYTNYEWNIDNPPPPYCDGSCPVPCVNGSCPESPIIIDLDGDGYELKRRRGPCAV